MGSYDPFSTNAERSVPLNTNTPVHGPVVLVAYDAAWPAMYRAEARQIQRALGTRALVLEHIGSTAVPGLIAKPCIDIVLGVADAADEAAYVPDLEAHGFVLRRREPDWNEHRVFKSERTNVNLHVWSADSTEIDRHINFRDWLRAHDDDRDRYAAAKRAIAARNFKHMNQYANAKDEIVREIQDRINRDRERQR